MPPDPDRFLHQGPSRPPGRLLHRFPGAAGAREKLFSFHSFKVNFLLKTLVPPLPSGAVRSRRSARPRAMRGVAVAVEARSSAGRGCFFFFSGRRFSVVLVTVRAFYLPPPRILGRLSPWSLAASAALPRLARRCGGGAASGLPVGRVEVDGIRHTGSRPHAATNIKKAN